jgi:hypothetical protein
MPAASTCFLRARVCHALVFVSLVAAGGCGKKDGGSSPNPSPSETETRTISQFFTAATAVGDSSAAAVVRTGSPPAPGGGPSVTASSIAQTAQSGLNLVSVQGSGSFQTIYLSIGTAQNARATPVSTVPAWALRLGRLFEAPLGAATTIQTSGFMQIDLPAPVTSASVILNYASSLPSTFEVRVQIAAAGGAAGPAASMPKTLQTSGGLIELVGIVLSTFGPNPSNPLGPGLYGPPVAGAVVSTSLDSRTATTNSQGAFDLLTDTPNAVGRCFRLTITAAGWPAYTTQGWIGSNKETGGVRFTLSPPQPPDLGSCS